MSGLYRLVASCYFYNEFKENHIGELDHFGAYSETQPSCVCFIREVDPVGESDKMVELLITDVDGSRVLSSVG